MRGIVLLALALAARPALAHEWYPASCCNERDCRPMVVTEVEVTPEGYYVPQIDRVIPFEEANSSPDGQYHICIGTLYHNLMPQPYMRSVTKDAAARERVMNRSGACFWAPDGAV